MDIDFGLRFGALIHQTTTPSLPQLELPLSHNLNIVEAFFYPPNAYSHYDSVSIDLASEVYQDHAKYPANHIRTLELFENDAHLYVVFKYKTTIVSRIVIPQDSVNKVFREGKINGIPCTSLYINEHSFTCEMWTGTDWAELYSPTLDSTRYILLSDEHDLLFTYFKCEAGFFEDPESGGTVLERSPGSKAALDTGMGGSWGSDSMAHDSYNDSDDPSLWEDDPYHSQHNHFSDSDDGFSRLERSLNHDTWDFPSPLSEYSGSSFSSFNLTHNHHHHHNLTTTTSTTKTSNTSPNIGSEPSTSKSFTSRSSTNPTPTSTPNPNSTNQNRLRVVFNKFRGHVRGEGSHDEDHPPHPSESASTATASAVSASALGISLDQIKHSSAMTTHATTPTTTSTTKLSSSSSSSSSPSVMISTNNENNSSHLSSTAPSNSSSSSSSSSSTRKHAVSKTSTPKLDHSHYAPVLSLLVSPLQKDILNQQLPSYQVNGALLFALNHAKTEPEIERAGKILEWLKVDSKRRVTDSIAAKQYITQTSAPNSSSKKQFSKNRKQQTVSVSSHVKQKSPQAISVLQWNASLRDVIPSAGEWAEHINLIRFAGYKNTKLERISEEKSIPLETLEKVRKSALKFLAQNADKFETKTKQQVIGKYRGKHSLGSSCTARKLKEARLRVSWTHLATLSESEAKSLQRTLEKRSTVPRNYVTALKETARVVTSAAVLDLSTPVST